MSRRSVASPRGCPDWKACRRRGDGRLVTLGPAEFLVIHGVHMELAFLAGNEDALCIAADGDEGAGLYIVVAPVGDQSFYGLTSLGAQLHFVKDDE